MFLWSNLETVFEEQFKRALASCRFVCSKFRGGHVISETYLHIFPINASEYRYGILYAVAKSHPNGVLILEQTANIQLYGSEVGGFYQHRGYKMVGLVVESIVISCEEIKRTCVFVVQHLAFASQKVLCGQTEIQSSGFGVIQTCRGVEHHIRFGGTGLQYGVVVQISIDRIKYISRKAFVWHKIGII